VDRFGTPGTSLEFVKDLARSKLLLLGIASYAYRDRDLAIVIADDRYIRDCRCTLGD